MKKQKNENNTTLFHRRRQNEEDDKEDDEGEVDEQRPYLEQSAEKKRRNCSIPPLTLFRLKTLIEMKYHKEEAKISSRERTERDQKHEKERERAFFFPRFFILPMFVVFTYALFYTRAFTRTLLFKYTHTFIKKCCSLPRKTSLNRFYYGGASFCSATVGDDDPAERVAS